MIIFFKFKLLCVEWKKDGKLFGKIMELEIEIFTEASKTQENNWKEKHEREVD